MIALQRAFPTALWVRRNVGAAKDRQGNFIRFGRKGMADVHGILGGRAIEVEFKRPGESQTPDQRNWQKAVERAGGIYIVAHSAEEAVLGVERAAEGAANDSNRGFRQQPRAGQENA